MKKPHLLIVGILFVGLFAGRYWPANGQAPQTEIAHIYEIDFRTPSFVGLNFSFDEPDDPDVILKNPPISVMMIKRIRANENGWRGARAVNIKFDGGEHNYAPEYHVFTRAGAPGPPTGESLEFTMPLSQLLKMGEGKSLVITANGYSFQVPETQMPALKSLAQSCVTVHQYRAN